jgi:hypothetical protein
VRREVQRKLKINVRERYTKERYTKERYTKER